MRGTNHISPSRGILNRRVNLQCRWYKLAPDYDLGDRIAVMNFLQERQAAGETVTGLLFLDREADDLHDRINTVEILLNQLAEAELCPGIDALAKLNASLR